MVRRLEVLLVILVALWGILGAVGNVADWRNTTDGVATVASMSAFKGGPFRWRATSNVAIVTGGALFIALSKATTGVLCLIGATKMWRALKCDSQKFQSTKEFAIAGCVIAEVLLFGGFVVIAEGWYEMWPTVTLSMFMCQALDADGSCQKAVNSWAALRSPVRVRLR